MNTLNNVKVHNIYNKTKNFLNRPVDCFPQLLAGIASVGISGASVALSMMVLQYMIDVMKDEFVYLITYMPTFGLGLESTTNDIVGESTYYMYLLLRDMSFYIFLLVFGILGILILLENLSIAGMTMNKIKDAFKASFIGLIIIMIFPFLWDGFAEASSKSAIWMLNPLYNLDQLNVKNYCIYVNPETNEEEIIPKSSHNGCAVMKDGDPTEIEILPLETTQHERSCIDAVYNAVWVQDNTTDIDNDFIIKDDYVFLHQSKHIQTLLNDNANMYASAKRMKLGDSAFNPTEYDQTKRPSKFNYGYMLNEKDDYSVLCDPSLRINYVYEKAKGNIEIKDDIDTGFLDNLGEKFEDLVKGTTDFFFIRPLFISTLFMVTIGMQVMMYARIFVTEFMMIGFPLFVVLGLLLRPIAPTISSLIDEKFVYSIIPLLLVPFLIAMVFSIGSVTLLNNDINIVRTSDDDNKIEGIPDISNKTIGLWVQGMIVVTFAIIIPLLLIPFMGQFKDLTRQIGQGLTRAMIALNTVVTAPAQGAVGGMRGMGGSGGKQSGEKSPSGGSGGETGGDDAKGGMGGSGGVPPSGGSGGSGMGNIGVGEQILGGLMYGLTRTMGDIMGYEHGMSQRDIHVESMDKQTQQLHEYVEHRHTYDVSNNNTNTHINDNKSGPQFSNDKK